MMLHRDNLYLTPIRPFIGISGHVAGIPAVTFTGMSVTIPESSVTLDRNTHFLAAWQPVLFETRKQAEFKSLVRWAVDVDPLAI